MCNEPITEFGLEAAAALSRPRSNGCQTLAQQMDTNVLSASSLQEAEQLQQRALPCWMAPSLAQVLLDVTCNVSLSAAAAVVE